jgi:hypothetical protein
MRSCYSHNKARIWNTKDQTRKEDKRNRKEQKINKCRMRAKEEKRKTNKI